MNQPSLDCPRALAATEAAVKNHGAADAYTRMLLVVEAAIAWRNGDPNRPLLTDAVDALLAPPPAPAEAWCGEGI